MNFCTLFNFNFISRGIALYRSLKHFSPESKLYVYCFDDITYDILIKLNLLNLIPIPINNFETRELIAVKSSRTIGEYCWTCTPHIIRNAIKTYELDEIVYIDADLYFFASPACLLDEWRNTGSSVLITEHRYTPRYENSQRFGIYCVQFMAFRSDEFAMQVLDWWSDRCIEWCYAREEEGKFGDQKYLDDWTRRFSKVHVLQHLGGGVAPWNVQQYAMKSADDVSVYLHDLKSGIDFRLIFYHFHGLKIFCDGEVDLSTYLLGEDIKNIIYARYMSDLGEAAKILYEISAIANLHGIVDRPKSYTEILREFKRRCFRRFDGSLNVLRVSDLIQLK